MRFEWRTFSLKFFLLGKNRPESRLVAARAHTTALAVAYDNLYSVSCLQFPILVCHHQHLPDDCGLSTVQMALIAYEART